MKLQRPLSPYSYYSLFNKLATDQQSYSRSENPNMYSWRLTFQPLEPYSIPEVFSNRAIRKGSKQNLSEGSLPTLKNYVLPPDAHQYIKLVSEDQAKQQNDHEEQPMPQKHKRQQQLIEEKMDEKITQFREIEKQIFEGAKKNRKKMFKTNSVHRVIHRGSESGGQNAQIIEKLNRIGTGYQTQRKITPIYNKKVLQSFKDTDCLITRVPPRSQQTSRMASTIHKSPLFVENMIEKLQQPEVVEKKKILKQQSEGKFHFKNENQVNNIIRYIKQSAPQQQKEDAQQKRAKQQDFLVLDRLKNEFSSFNLSEKYPDQGRTKQIVVDPKKHFLDFQTYFIKNYQVHNNGLSSVLPQNILRANQNFHDKLIDMADT